MQNQLNSQYLPNQMYTPYCQMPAYCVPNQPACSQTQPSSSVGAVNIQIYNPQANPNGGYCQYPYNYNNNFAYPAVTAMPVQTLLVPVQTQLVPVQSPVQTIPVQTQPYAEYNQLTPAVQNSNQSMNLNGQNNNVAAASETDKTKKEEDEKFKKEKVILTDDYIKSLENYLNSEDQKIRLLGAKELMQRFKEDETRIDDAALTALLNKTLQDPSDTVKFVGLTTLDLGFAHGNNETAQILSNMQADTSNYGEDARLASKILLKMSGTQSNMQAKAQDNAAVQNNNGQMNALNAAPSANAAMNVQNNIQNIQPNTPLNMAQPNITPQSNTMNAVQQMPPNNGDILQN